MGSTFDSTQTPEDAIETAYRVLNASHWNQQPLSQELLIQVLRTEERRKVIGEASGERQARLEDYIVSHLIDQPEVDYDTHADILYDLAGQVVAHFKSKHDNEDDIRNILQGHGRQMAASIFADMKKNMWRGQTNYRVTLDATFQELKPQTFEDRGEDYRLHFKTAPADLNQIKKFIFEGFQGSCYQLAKFDSNTERQLAELLALTCEGAARALGCSGARSRRSQVLVSRAAWASETFDAKC